MILRLNNSFRQYIYPSLFIAVIHQHAFSLLLLLRFFSFSLLLFRRFSVHRVASLFLHSALFLNPDQGGVNQIFLRLALGKILTRGVGRRGARFRPDPTTLDHKFGEDEEQFVVE
jgi:hypothetical protein